MNAPQCPSPVEQKPASGRPGWKAIAGFLALSLLLPVVLFGCAGDLAWTAGWLYVAIVLVVSIGSRLVLMRVNPGLVQERASSVERADVGAKEKVLLSVLVGLCPPATWVIGGLSHRFGWPGQSSQLLVWIGAALLLLGGVVSGWAMVVNRFFSAVVRIQADRGQVVISSGPYRFVRHPGYLGALLVNVAGPLVLQAHWAFLPALLSTVAIFLRTAGEDRLLRAELPGYADYAARTRYRLVPPLW